MALVESQEFQTEVLPVSQFHQVQVRRSDIITDDVSGEVKARTFHRHVLAPGADISTEAPEVQAVCNAVWSPDIVSAYQAKKALADGEPSVEQ